jgi:hypothetical protein
VLLGLFCKLKSDESGLGGNFLLAAKTPSFLPQPNSSTSQSFCGYKLKSTLFVENIFTLVMTETKGFLSTNKKMPPHIKKK